MSSASRLDAPRPIWLCLFALGACLGSTAFAQDRELVLVSQTSDIPNNDDSEDPEISGDGRFILFETDASNLVAGDDNDEEDLFLFDLLTGELQLVSRTPDGSVGNDRSANILTPGRDNILSTDGRFAAFVSRASDLTDDVDTNGEDDVFVYDRLTQTNTLISRALAGGAGNARSSNVQITPDGMTVVFESTASDLTAMEDTNDREDIFLWDGTDLTLISKGAGPNGVALGGSSPQVSSDGNWVSFTGFDLGLTGGTGNRRGLDLFL